ncbi:CoA-binding protein [Legionella tunisiensis]|uniref:CoA-binding protein n=1 Tax=Legionella tunisiensis TaxID=1034944 RepID=UPI0003163F7D|nr:CoA-binding protein [Legionella tunisiensis]
MSDKIKQFFSSSAYAVIGASNNRQKVGNKVLRCYLQHNKTVYPVNPGEKMVEGVPCITEIAQLPQSVNSISIITPPWITEKIVAQAIKKGIQNIWMQPGAESDTAISNCLKNKINIIANGPCILVELGFIDC